MTPRVPVAARRALYSTLAASLLVAAMLLALLLRSGPSFTPIHRTAFELETPPVAPAAPP